MQRQMKKTIPILLALLLLFPVIALAEGQTCPVCGARDLASLAMVCPECDANLHNPVLKNVQKPRAQLRIRLLYTGGSPDRMPPYGKLYINGRYCGNINLIEKQKADNEFTQVWANGLGKDFTAYYEKIVDNIPAGTLKVEVEMKFSRFYGFGSSLKRVVFPYTTFSAGENTSLDHYFSSAATFNQHKPVKKQPVPIVSEAKLQGADGNVALNVPLFR